MTGKAKSDDRAERLAQQLRANLRRRKAQARARADNDETAADPAAPERENDEDG
ncbi:hypothetical protein [Halovulum marinum]|uniref:hypothetical protein n=1 Tax=Halovulum marinum TaxID=2662447 RepID=UPI001F182FA3|nr:hypothetical protein [Halovulum marinum]